MFEGRNGRTDPDYRGPFFDDSVQGDRHWYPDGRQEASGGDPWSEGRSGDDGRRRDPERDLRGWDDRRRDWGGSQSGRRSGRWLSHDLDDQGGQGRRTESPSEGGNAYDQFTGVNERTGMAARQGASSGKRFSPRDYQRDDRRVREDVCERLLESHWLDVADVEVAVSDGVVTLTGSVRDRTHQVRIEDIVDDVFGVKEVRCQLRAQRPDGRRPGAAPVRPAAQAGRVSGISSSGAATGSQASSYGGGLEVGEGEQPRGGRDLYHGTTTMPSR